MTTMRRPASMPGPGLQGHHHQGARAAPVSEPKREVRGEGEEDVFHSLVRMTPRDCNGNVQAPSLLSFVTIALSVPFLILLPQASLASPRAGVCDICSSLGPISGQCTHM